MDSRRTRSRLKHKGWLSAALAAGMSLPGFGRAAAPASLSSPLAAQSSPAASSPAPVPMSDDEVLAILKQRLDVDTRGVAIVVGLIDSRGVHVIAHGPTSRQPDAPAADGKTIFEIGSVTKVFTTLLLAGAVQRGEVKLDDPVAKDLPAGTRLPERGNRQITLLDLATHRSGLPSVPSNMKSADEQNPWADYTGAQMFEFLAGFELKDEIGTKFAYSNLGMGLLGQALALRAGKAYEDLVIERVCNPLGLSDTRITMSPELRARMAVPYDQSLAATKPWDVPAIAGAGALRSDVDDLLKFVSVQLDPVTLPKTLAAAIQETHEVRGETDTPKLEIALGWHVLTPFDAPVYWQNGGTGGSRSFVGFCPARHTGLVVLSNSAFGVDDIGLHLLDDRFEIRPPSRTRVAVPVASAVADRYLGRYEVIPQFLLTFSREGDRYFVQPTDQDKDEVFPESETDFFSKTFDGSVSFVGDTKGQFSLMIVHQAGLPDQTARRAPDAPPPAPSP